ncbi:hypothetical protein SmJEL517_g05981 [Synchytrium microbalum]|uniref:Uncharacterized protein n=1 Tax=Synchytrium microbalum TaxID=1806994 RepID=A0A507BYP0_9FUNG|nr:uncharacterized protein SmJEL517_g05981 [Synchytrium microbalum]TPX30455.1 hypothetical protein SmJEL517_g05981 [Synchytrium microbalum]
MTQAFQKVFAEEGIRGLWMPGLWATIWRELIYSGLRFSLYKPIRTTVGSQLHIPNPEGSLLCKSIAGICSGVIGSMVANPTDVLKIKSQSEAGSVVNGVYTTGHAKGRVPKYFTMAQAIRTILRDEGIRGFYRGVQATALRAIMVSGGQLVPYDHTKYLLKKHGVMKEGLPLHVAGSIVAGLTATTMAAPPDIIKTRLLSQSQHGSASSQLPRFKGISDCLVHIVRKEGVSTLFRGWLPSYLRLAPHYLLSLPLYEQLRLLMGLDGF